MKKGFTLIETIVTVSILVILISIAVPVINNIGEKSSLENIVIEVVNDLKLAKTRTIGSEGNSPWGVYFVTTTPYKYIVFQGVDYDSRDVLFDENHALPRNVIFSSLNLEGGVDEVVFDKITGKTSGFGTITLDFETGDSNLKTVYIESSGNVSNAAPSASDANRVKDSRHTHFTYTRNIDTLLENIVLTFEGGLTEKILILDNMEAGQIFWNGTINISGEDQTIKLHTHSLNVSNTTVFCVHRDLRYNTKSVGIDIDGDPKYMIASPVLLDFLADDSIVKGGSDFVSDPTQQ